MSHHTKEEADKASTTGKPDTWNRDEMKRDHGDDSDVSTEHDAEVPTWNEGQMARQRPDGTREAGQSDEEIEEESEGGLSGGGVNPGGGERWAERDRER
jgi:hypothetical protein